VLFGGLLVTFSKLIGKKVIGANAYTLGEAQGADVDTDKWQITHLHISLTDEATRELGYKKTPYRPRNRLSARQSHSSHRRRNHTQQIHSRTKKLRRTKRTPLNRQQSPQLDFVYSFGYFRLTKPSIENATAPS